tara:strand:- start:19833 stop:20342 length:510 start_codon:yes stop_codon:yes gene_type:complete
MYSILEKIKIAKVSQFLAENDIDKKGLYGGGVDVLLPTKIYNIRKSVEWMYGINPPTNEVRAKGYIDITSVGRTDPGIIITVYVDDPDLGIIVLGTYTVLPSDTSTGLVAIGLANSLTLNTYGYYISRIDSTITIEARAGVGASINDNNRIQVVLTLTIFDNTFDNTFN